MAQRRRSGKLAVILHADIAGSTTLVQQDEDLAHERIQDSFRRFRDTITQYHGHVRELRGDALLAEFERASDAAPAALAFQAEQADHNSQLNDNIRPKVRVGIAMGEVIVADNTVTGAGVVLAQRVEQLAEPGGMCITGAIREALPQRMPFIQTNLGERQVKGFDEPVHVYRVELKSGQSIPPPQERGQPQALAKTRRLIVAVAAIVLVVAGGVVYWSKPWAPQEEPASVDRMAFPLPVKPSIAVLPFTNMSDDPKQEYFVDGMTEDLITDLSTLSGLFVISRNSAFVYKGKAVGVRQVAEDLGVRYVLEGSVRRVKDQVRVNAQLIDATTGGQLWANRYDDQLDNIFALQDRITKKIFAALAVELSAGEQEKLDRKETNNIEAYDAFLKGWEHYRRWTPEDFRKALPFFQRAIELDSQYGRAYAAIASIYTEGYQKAWDWSHVVGVSAEAMPGLAGEYLKEALENPTPLAHQVASKWYVILLFPEESIAAAARAIALDPNDAIGYAAMATALIYSGKPEEAIDFVDKAIRFDPHNMPNYLFTLGMAYFGMEQFQRSVSVFERAFKLNPELGLVQRAYLAAAYVQLGQVEKAEAELDKPDIKEVRELYDLYVKYEGAYYRNPEDTARLINGLQKIELGRGG
jgi:TolB-like protein/class 3 adenylate cyclase